MRKMIALLMLVTALSLIPSAVSGAEEQGVISQVNVYAEDSLGRSIPGGTLSFATFPQTVRIKSSATSGGRIASVVYEDPSGKRNTGDRITIRSVSDTGTYIVTATSQDGAVRTIAVNIKYEVRASQGATYRYRTVGIEIHSISKGGTTVRNGLKKVVRLKDRSYLDESAYKTVRELVGAADGCLYTLEGSLVVEVYNSYGVTGTYVVSGDWKRLVNDYEWVPETLIAFGTMCRASVTYQAPRTVSLIRRATDQTGISVISSRESSITLYPYQSFVMETDVSGLITDSRYSPIRSYGCIEYADGKKEIRSGSRPDSISVSVISSMSRVTAEFRCEDVVCDLAIAAPDKQEYPENEDIVTCLSFSAVGMDIVPGSRVSVKIEIPELRYSAEYSVVCRQGTTISVPFRWHSPEVASDRKITARAELKKGSSIREYSYENNSCTFSLTVKNIDRSLPEEVYRQYPPAPSRQQRNRVEWTEQRFENGVIKTYSFYAKLTAKAEISYSTMDRNFIRSGYGFGLKVSYAIETDYDRPGLITDCQLAWTCVPQFGYSSGVYMDRYGGSAWQLPVSPRSHEGLRRIYVPIWWSDSKKYAIQTTCGDVYTPGGVLRVWITGSDNKDLNLKIRGSMYDDDHIGY